MFGTHDLALFIASGLLLNIAPGPDSLLVVTRSAAQGWRAGSAAAFGIGAGIFVHIFAAALGLSAVLATSATAFAAVKYAGAAYLLYIGIGLLVGKRNNLAGTKSTLAPAPLTYRKIFMQGFLTNVLNPKVALFFLAFVPQFMLPDSTNKALAFIVLGCIFNFNGMLWCNLLAVVTAFTRSRIRAGNALSRWIGRLVGALFVSFGVKLALTQGN